MNDAKYFRNNPFLVIQLVVCVLFVYGFIKMNIKIDASVHSIKEEKKRNENLLAVLDSLHQIMAVNILPDSFVKAIKHENIPTKYLVLIKGKKDAKPPKDSIKKTVVNVAPTPNSNSVKGREVVYQTNFSNNMVRLNNYEKIMLLTAFLKFSTPHMSSVSIQEVYENEEGEAVSKMIYLNCIQSLVTNDSLINFRFSEEQKTTGVVLDPVNYNRNFGISLTGSLSAPFLNCILLWKEITGKPNSIQFKLLLKQ